MALHYDGEVKITKVAGMSSMMNNGYLVCVPCEFGKVAQNLWSGQTGALETAAKSLAIHRH